MKRLALVSVLAISLLMGCSGANTPATQPAMSASPKASQGSTAWTNVSEKIRCEAVNPSDCVGTYGFEIDATGKYLVGPAPDGTRKSGNVTSEELQTISEDMTSVLNSGVNEGFTCASDSGIMGTQDSVFVTQPTQAPVEVFRSENPPQGSDCYKGNADSVFELHSDLNRMMTKYYPRPFP